MSFTMVCVLSWFTTHSFDEAVVIGAVMLVWLVLVCLYGWLESNS